MKDFQKILYSMLAGFSVAVVFAAGVYAREKVADIEAIKNYLQVFGILGGFLALALLWQRTMTLESKETREKARDFRHEVRQGIAMLSSEKTGEQAAGAAILDNLLRDAHMTTELASEIEQAALYMFKPNEFPRPLFMECAFRMTETGYRLIPRALRQIRSQELKKPTCNVSSGDAQYCIHLDTVLHDLWYSNDLRARTLARAESKYLYDTVSQPILSDPMEIESSHLADYSKFFYDSRDINDPVAN